MAVAIPGPGNARGAATQTFGALTIDKRVLTTPSRTIAIANISTVGVGTHVEPRPRLLYGILFVAFLVLAFVSTESPGGYGPRGPNTLTGILGGLSLVFLLLALRPDDKTHYLLVSSNDGALSRFTGPDIEVLGEVRRILTDKINKGDEASTFNINFEKGVIETLSVGQAGAVHAPTHVNGSGNTVATNGAIAVNGKGHHVNAANGVNGRAGTHDASNVLSRSPGAQLANGHSQNGAHHANHETQVDFSRLIPVVVEMHRFYERQPGAEHLSKRLEELELLMRSGAAMPKQKSRIRELAGELSQILQAYPQVVQVFHDIRGAMAI